MIHVGLAVISLVISFWAAFAYVMQNNFEDEKAAGEFFTALATHWFLLFFSFEGFYLGVWLIARGLA